MKFIPRSINTQVQSALARGKSVLLLGARQTGKTTLLNQFQVDFSCSFMRPKIRQRYEQIPDLLTAELEALAEDTKKTPIVWIDEIQKVPSLLDVIQDLIDRKIAQFLLTGSSARKLREQISVNWLPGRLVVLHLDPFTQLELDRAKLNVNLETLLCDGSLPGIITSLAAQDREIDLKSYVYTYLEEEVRAEALVRNVGHFAKFLHLAASESGQILNFRKLSQEVGVAHTTISSYYQILEDCLIIECIQPLTLNKTRRRLTQTPKYLFFDLGVRRLSARESINPPQSYWGHLFEQWVGLELLRYMRSTQFSGKLYFWRDSNGPEVDWVVQYNDSYIPIEVKWTDKPRPKDTKYLSLFKNEYISTKKAILVCRVPCKLKLSEGIYACPWNHFIPAIFDDLS